MGNFRPLPTSCWENFLRFHGFVETRSKGSHFQWVKKGHRTIPVWGNEKPNRVVKLLGYLKTFSKFVSVLSDIYKAFKGFI